MTCIIPKVFRTFYSLIMKPTIPETGTVIKLSGNTADVMLRGGTPCKGCGAGKMGLCRPAGTSMVITVKNTAGAQIRETVTVGIDRRVQRKAYLLAYIVPLFSLLAGSLLGYAAGNYLSVPFLDAGAGFVMLVLSSAVAFLRLKKLDRASMMTIKNVVRENTFEAGVKTDEEKWYERYEARSTG